MAVAPFHTAQRPNVLPSHSSGKPRSRCSVTIQASKAEKRSEVEMPPKDDPFTISQIAQIEKWIAEGAVDDTPANATPDAATDSATNPPADPWAHISPVKLGANLQPNVRSDPPGLQRRLA